MSFDDHISKQPPIQLIRQLCAKGYEHYDTGDYKTALRSFYQAWLHIPKPQTDWEAAGWVLTAIGDSYFRAAQYQQGSEALESALCCPEMTNSPFIHLRLGQCQWELQLFDQAQKSLLRAHELAQLDIFSTEDRKYYLAIAELISLHSPQNVNPKTANLSDNNHGKTSGDETAP